MISQETLDEIKTKINIADVVGESVALKRNGSNIMGLCPFHSEKTPSFHVRDEAGYFHCFGCGASGNVISFVMETQGVSFPEAVELLANRYGIEVRQTGKTQKRVKSESPQPYYELNYAAFKYYSAALKKAPASVKEYLVRRGLDEKIEKGFGIGIAPNEWRCLTDSLKKKGVSEDILVKSGLAKRNKRGELYDVLRGRLVFPVWIDSKRIAGFGGRVLAELYDEESLKTAPKYLNSPESPVYHKSKILYGFPQASTAIRETKSVYLVEGYMDVVSLWRAGVENVLAACGTAVTEDHVRRLRNLVKRVTVFFDGDDAGRAAAGKTFALFLNSGIDATAVFLKEGQDPDDLAREFGEETASKLEAMPRSTLLECFIRSEMSKFGIDKVTELGAASKGKLSQTVAKVIAKIENTVERDERASFAASLLDIEPARLYEMVSQAASGEQVKWSEEIDEEPVSEMIGTPVVSELPKVDRDILHAVMAEKETLAREVLSSSEMCAGLHPSTIMFIQGLNEVMDSETNETEKKELIKHFLSGFGKSWIEHWKESYLILKDGEADLRQSFADCKKYFEKSRLSLVLSELDEQIKQAESHDEEKRLHQKKLTMMRKHQNL